MTIGVTIHDDEVKNVSGLEYIVPWIVCRCNICRPVASDRVQCDRAEYSRDNRSIICDVIEHRTVGTVSHRIEGDLQRNRLDVATMLRDDLTRNENCIVSVNVCIKRLRFTKREGG